MADSAFFCTLSHERILAFRRLDAGRFRQCQWTCNLGYLRHTQPSLPAARSPIGGRRPDRPQRPARPPRAWPHQCPRRRGPSFSGQHPCDAV
ncbi:hypothetical protein B1218_36900 [Pseudomonas ogarae]|nr:hypothetical protein B1218_36900 [Pseudomonas ogarae]